MPVDKFGHTDSATTQRVVAGGVTLTQVNNTFARLDGSNAFVGKLNMGGNSIKGLPTDYSGYHAGDEAVSFSQALALVADEIHNSEDPTADNHFTNKKYVDEQGALKVSKSGDTMAGNLFLSVNGDRTRRMGCKDLVGNKQFILLLGSTTNTVQGQLNNPIILQSADGYRFRTNNETALEIVKSNDSNPPSKINVYKNIFMHDARITGLGAPSDDGDAATKNYVDK